MVAQKQCWFKFYISLTLVSVVLSQNVASTKTKQIQFIGLFAMSGAWPGGLSCLPSAMMALEHVNSREDILREYELVMHVNDTECEGGKGTDSMYWQLYRPPIKTLILGDGCSIVAEPTARASKHWNMVMLSWAAASPALSDKNIYPRFLRMASPDQLMNPGRIAMLKEFNWKKVAAISETFALFSAVTDDLIIRIPNFNITMITSEIFTDDPSLQIQNLKRHDARIIFLGAYEENSAKVICEVYRNNLYGHKYVWIYPSWYSTKWWEKFDVGCTTEELVTALEGSFATGFIMANTVEEKGVARLTSKEFAALFDKLVPPGPDRIGIGEWYNTYDGIWAIALTLNKTIEKLAAMGMTIDEFTYNNEEMANIIQETMYEVEFLGVRGPVYFDENGDSFLPMEITQLQNGVMKRVGLYSPTEDTLTWTDNKIIWSGGSVPKDSTTYIIELTYVSGPVYTAVCAFAAIGIVIAFFLLIFNIVYRKYRLIKMSSPVMNNIILAGCIVSYLTVFIQELSDQYVEILCKVRTLTVMIGFSLSVGALFAKTWRVYVIFTNKTKKVILRDYQLVLIVCVIVGVDVLVFVIREFLAPLQVERQIAVTEEYDDGDLVVQKEIMICKSDYGLYFQGIIYGYKGLMLIFGAFLAWQTRKVNIPALNDSQYIGMCIYNVAVLSILGVILVFVLDNQVQLQYVLTSGFLIFGTTIIQLIIFIPKVLKFRDAKSQVEEEGTEAGSQIGKAPGTMTTALGDDGKEVERLKKENETLKGELDKTKGELKKAEEILAETKKELEKHKK